MLAIPVGWLLFIILPVPKIDLLVLVLLLLLNKLDTGCWLLDCENKLLLNINIKILNIL